GVMTLAAECGSQLVLRATGDDAETALDALADVATRDFGDL
ncbi:MAG: HPr family phosphocarrier protein, partial [Gemmatimonadota bacterium]